MNVGQAKSTSRSFHLAFQRALEQRHTKTGQLEVLIVPAVVSVAFSIELGLKALALSKGTQPRGHELDKLFGTLDVDDQNAIKALVNLPEMDFRKELKSAAAAFLEWRYIYEATGRVSANLSFLQCLSNALQSRLWS